jgi:hypothetical protein
MSSFRAVAGKPDSLAIPNPFLLCLKLRAGRGPARMAAPLSQDLRVRVIEAVEKGGMSRRAAAVRFGIGVRTAVRWVNEFGSAAKLVPARWATRVRRS